MGTKGIFGNETQTAAVQTNIPTLALLRFGTYQQYWSNALLPQMFRFSVYPVLQLLLCLRFTFPFILPCMLDDWRYHSKEPYKYINRKRYYFYHLHRDKRQVFIFSNRRNYRWSIVHRKPNKYKNRSQHRWQSMRKVVIASQKHMYSR